MGIKISELPQNTLPYRGSEEFPLVQGIETRSGTLSSLVSYLSGDFAFVNRSNEFTKSQAISGNLTVTGEISASVFNAVSANFTVIDIKQYELSGFSVTGDVSLTGDLSAAGDLNIQGRSIIDTDTTEDALRVTQRGPGMALRIEDTTNVDSTPFVITSTGRVGIGTSEPNEKLTVIGNVSATDGLITSGIGVVDTNTTQDALRVTQRGTGLALRIEDDTNVDSTPFVVTSTGNVGAGTTAPNEKLTVIGNISATSGIITSGISVVDTNTTQDALRVTQRGTGLAIRVEDDSNVDSSPFAVTATGTVGIGTELPNEKLTVIGNISATGIITTSNAGVIDTNTSQAALRVTQRGTGLALRIEDDTNVDTTPFVVTSTGAVGVGTELPNEKLTVVGNISATGVAYTRELDFGSSERPSLTGIKQALNSFLYVAPALSYVRVNGSSSASLEVGQALTAPAITWTSNKVEAAAVSNYSLTLPTSVISTGSNTFTFSAFNDTNTYNITTLPGTNTQATSAWSVRVTDWANAQSTSSVTATWRYRVYYGATSQATPTDAQVIAGTEASTLATSRTGLGSYTTTPNNEYMFVAYPSRFGATSQFRVNGLPNTAFTLVTINTFTNAYGGTAQYFVYRSDNLLTGTYTIEVF